MRRAVWNYVGKLFENCRFTLFLNEIATPKTSEQVPKFWVRNDSRTSLRRHCESAHKKLQLTKTFLADAAISSSTIRTKLNQHALYSLQMILEQIATPKTSEQVPKFWVRNDSRTSLRRHCESAHKKLQLTINFLADAAISSSLFGFRL